MSFNILLLSQKEQSKNKYSNMSIICRWLMKESNWPLRFRMKWLPFRMKWLPFRMKWLPFRMKWLPFRSKRMYESDLWPFEQHLLWFKRDASKKIMYFKKSIKLWFSNIITLPLKKDLKYSWKSTNEWNILLNKEFFKKHMKNLKTYKFLLKRNQETEMKILDIFFPLTNGILELEILPWQCIQSRFRRLRHQCCKLQSKNCAIFHFKILFTSKQC